MTEESTPGAGASAARGTTEALVEALVAISSDLELSSVLRRIARAACEITGARYGALGVLGGVDHPLSRFVTWGLDETERAALGAPPVGRGILGLLITDPETIRLHRLQDHPISAGFPPNHPPMERFLGVPVRVRGTVFGNLYLCDKVDGSEFTAEDERMVEVLAAGAAHVIENARSYERSERRRILLEAVAQVNDLAQSADGADAVARQVAISARRLTAGDAAAVVRLGAEGAELIAVDGPEAHRLESLVPSLHVGLSEAARTGGAPTRIPVGTGEVSLVPLREHLGEGGAVVVSRARPFDPADLELLGSLADQVSLAFDRLRAEDQAKRLLVVADRERIARDLHDVVIQRLFATGLQLQALARRTEDAAVLERIGDATRSLDTTIHDIRSAIFDLEHVGGASFRARLAELVEEYAGLLGHRPTVRVSGPVDTLVGEAVAEQATAVVREALSNVARHARATGSEVQVVAEPDRLTVAVLDDGVGLPARLPRESGLRNLRERAAALGGTAVIGAGPRGGTRMRWEVPLS